jgi:hypothetical protein
MGLVLWWTGGLLLPVAFVAGVAVYGLCLALLGGIRFARGRLPALHV